MPRDQDARPPSSAAAGTQEAADIEGDEFAPDELAILRELFRDEAHEALERLTSHLLAAHVAPLADDATTELMRITHTLKGSAGTVGLPVVVAVAHELEDHFARLQGRCLPWSAPVLDALVETIDALRSYVDALDTPASHRGLPGLPGLEERMRHQLGTLRALQGASAEPGARTPAAEPAAEHSGVLPAPGPSLEAEPSHGLPAPGACLETLPGNAIPEPLPERSEPSDGMLVPYERIEDTTRSIVAGTGMEGWRRDGSGMLRVPPARIDDLMDSVGELTFDRTRIERRVQGANTTVGALEGVLDALRAQAQRLASADTLAEREHIAAALGRIESDMAAHIASLRRAARDLIEETEALRRTTAALQDGLTRVRMSSAGSLFQALSRQLRTIARSAGKKVQLFTSGADTEFDKTVAERIIDPLVQLLRNAVAHGIEPEHVRISQGKRPEGVIRIDARQEGSLVIIEVIDDGAGIDPAMLRKRFVAAGQWSRAKADLATDEEVLHALFDPGVSTRDEADHLAGRGVGLDTVRETIARLGGEVRMTSTPGKGTRFTLRLPVSTAVSQALLFKVGGDVYALPNVHVLAVFEVAWPCADGAAASPGSAGGTLPRQLEVHDSYLPLLWLQELFALGLRDMSPKRGAAAAGNASVPAIVLEYAGRRLAVTCDKLVGPREIVVKELGPLLSPLPLYAGATISGSGKVQLILDPAALVRLAYPDTQPAPAAPPPAALAGSRAGFLAAAASSAAQARTLPARALVADDSRAIREAVSSILASSGYQVELAEDGARAWELAQAANYDLVVTDIEMPHLDGFGLIERIRADRRLIGMPIIIVSSRDTPGHRERARELSVRGFVSKPVTRRKLLDALELL